MKLPKITRQKAIAMTLGYCLSMVYMHTGFLGGVMAFLLVGAIPGTSFNLPPAVMLALYIAFAWLMIFGFSMRRLTDLIVKNRQALKNYLPKRRFGRV